LKKGFLERVQNAIIPSLDLMVKHTNVVNVVTNTNKRINIIKRMNGKI